MVITRDVLQALMGVYGIQQQSRQSMPCIGRSLRHCYGSTDTHGRSINNKSANKQPFIIRGLSTSC
ncbi:hypothetical protein [Nostoc sp. C110]|uniref:hypothetical protein n=1 Tax=Nostoc sp. C110 TaxID=3349876 RepID=UPI00370D22EC